MRPHDELRAWGRVLDEDVAWRWAILVLVGAAVVEVLFRCEVIR